MHFTIQDFQDICGDPNTKYSKREQPIIDDEVMLLWLNELIVRNSPEGLFAHICYVGYLKAQREYEQKELEKLATQES